MTPSQFQAAIKMCAKVCGRIASEQLKDHGRRGTCHEHEGALLCAIAIRALPYSDLLASLPKESGEEVSDVRALVKRLDSYYSEWSARCRSGTPYGEGDWHWLAEHLRDIARSYVAPELSDDLRERRDAAIRLLAAAPDQRKAAGEENKAGAASETGAGFKASDSGDEFSPADSERVGVCLNNPLSAAPPAYYFQKESQATGSAPAAPIPPTGLDGTPWELRADLAKVDGPQAGALLTDERIERVRAYLLAPDSDKPLHAEDAAIANAICDIAQASLANRKEPASGK